VSIPGITDETAPKDKQKRNAICAGVCDLLCPNAETNALTESAQRRRCSTLQRSL
jgi:hypothetical protein